MAFKTIAEVSEATGISDGYEVLPYKPKEPCDLDAINEAQSVVADAFKGMCNEVGSEFTRWVLLTSEQQTAIRAMVYTSLDAIELKIELASTPLFTAPEAKISPRPTLQVQVVA